MKAFKDTMVVKSIELPGGSRCVDLFMRVDGSFGFEEYRQDSETNSGWFPVGNFSGLRLETENDALKEAIVRMPWLRDLVG